MIIHKDSEAGLLHNTFGGAVVAAIIEALGG